MTAKKKLRRKVATVNSSGKSGGCSGAACSANLTVGNGFHDVAYATLVLLVCAVCELERSA